MAQQLNPPPLMPIGGFKELRQAEAYCKALYLYLEELRQRVGLLLP